MILIIKPRNYLTYKNNRMVKKIVVYQLNEILYTYLNDIYIISMNMNMGNVKWQN